jgi:hypothetical protein
MPLPVGQTLPLLGCQLTVSDHSGEYADTLSGGVYRVDVRSIVSASTHAWSISIQDIAAIIAPRSTLFVQVKHAVQSLVVRDYLD